MLPSNFLTLPFLIVTLQSLIKFWLFGHWPRKFARWLIGSTKKVISIYTFWVIVLLLRWFMNHNSCNSLLVILRYLNRSMVVGSSTGQAKYLDRSRNLSKLLTKDHRTISLATWLTWIFARWLIGSTKKSNINLYILSNCIASSLIYEP